MNKNIETRIFKPTEELSFRAEEVDDKRFISGYAAVFNHPSKLLYENNKFFNEVIAPGAFDEVLRSENLNVIFTFNHMKDKILARSVSGTLELSTDDKGLHYRAEVPNVSYANDVFELVKRGDLFESSFAYAVTRDNQEWTRSEDGTNIRTIKKVSYLADVSVVINAVYSTTDTEVAVRMLKETIEKPDTKDKQRLNNEIEILKIKNKIIK